MRFYSLTIFVLLLIISGCAPSPDIPLTPQLSPYAETQQQCRTLLSGEGELGTEVEKACDEFLKRLEKSNATGTELSTKKLKKSEQAIKETEYARQRLKLKFAHEALTESVKKATLTAIKEDDADAFSAGVSFPEISFVAPYYAYMKTRSPRFDNDPRYLEYQDKESGRLMSKGEHYLGQGKEEKARKLFEKAANMGNPLAARSAALLYEENDIEQALFWHHKAVERNATASLLNLARLYETQGQEETAVTWYVKAAQSGDAKAQYRLYRMSYRQDKEKALSWLQRSAQSGYPQAQYDYGRLLMEEKKAADAINFLQQASQNSYQPASDFLGKYFYDLKLYDNAMAYLSQSESADSFYLRAKIAENAPAGGKDYGLAYTFYSKASALGRKEALDDAERIKHLQSKEQQRIAEEEKKARAEKMAAMVKECGEMPTASSIKKGNRRFHITGTASSPLGRHSFIIYGDDGESYYLLQAKGVQEDEHVDISVRSTGKTASLSTADDDEPREIYQFTYIKSCVAEEEQ